MDSFGILKISASALYAQRSRMNVIASNMANINSTKTQEGGPYKRKDVVFVTMPFKSHRSEVFEGVRIAEIAEDSKPPIMIHDPGHPDANKEGFVALPNINIIEEMVNMMMATRAYEANVTAFNLSKSMFMKALEIGR